MTMHGLTFAYDDGDIDTNRSTTPHLNTIVAERYSRRQTLMGGLTAMTSAVFGGALLAGCGGGEEVESAGLSVSGAASGSAASGRTVTLTGTVTGSADSVGWVQVSGPSVTLSNAATNVATFTAPSVATGTELTFRFTALSRGTPTDTIVSVTVGAATLGFTAVAKSLADIVAVPAGYSVGVIYRLGDPITASVAAYGNAGADTNFAQRAGDHHDGMTYFGLAASGNTPDPASNARGLLALNHENITQAYLHPNGPTNTGGVRPEAEAI